ncbi:MAG: PQQ-binding-like beta-propeller repeat protein [Deltaproteobacteria bacterium]|nr:PQQ-binding-like beta-propeller repeat protein [Deltaproteobacteria bacterium]
MQGSIIVGAFLAAAGCASVAGSAPAQEQLPNQPVLRSEAPQQLCSKWKLGLHSHLSHISAARDGHRILIATSAGKKSEGELRFVNGSGKILWSKNLDQPVKAQAISADGNFLAVNTYDGKLLALDGRSGKKLWEHEHLGRPVVFSRTRRVILLNDDDSEPRTAFTSYDFKGKLLATVTTTHEPLDMDTPEDESYVAITTTDKSVFAYEPAGKLLWHGKLPGDAVSIETTGGKDPRIYVISVQAKSKVAQALTAFAPGTSQGSELVALWTVALDRKYEAVRSSGGALFLYGNTHVGQALAAYHAATGAEIWRRSYAIPANYSSLVFSAEADRNSFMTAALDEGVPAGTLHVMAVDKTGAARWDAPISASSGLYSYAFAENAPALVIGAGEPGDGLVEYFDIAAKCQKR